MDWFLFLTGLLVLILTLLDISLTALSSNGAGYLTDLLCRGVWEGLKKTANNDGSKRYLEKSGILIIGLLLFLWIGLIWLGHTLIFAADPGSILHDSTYETADFWEKMYTVGYLLSTMGLGDYVLSTSAWKIYAAVVSFSGLILLTTFVTYLIPVLSAEIEKKNLSLFISCFGNSVADLLQKQFNGENFDRFNDLIVEVEQPIIAHGQKHLAYPILNYFHNSDRAKSFILNLTILDESIYLLLYHVEPARRPDTERLMRLRRAINTFLTANHELFVKPASKPLPPPDLAALQAKGLPLTTVPPDPPVESRQDIDKRRKLLRSLIEFEGWRADQIYTNPMTL